MTYIDTTKIQLPKSTASLIDRPRLHELITAHIDKCLTLIVAPAGYGKSTLAARWAVSADRPTAWVGLNGAGRNAADLARYIVEAIRAASTSIPGSFGQSMLDLASGSADPDPRRLATELTTALRELVLPIAIVIDNFGAPNQAGVNDFTGHFALRMPSNAHLVITSRSQPRLPLSQLRLHGAVNEIRDDALVFTAEEARIFLNDALRLGLTADQIATLLARTEGWIAGLRLASLTLQDSSDIGVSVEVFNGTNRYVQSYLVDEVLEGQPEIVREFLSKTSVTTAFNEELAETLTGRPDSTQILDRIENDNLFLFPVDQTLKWYRYHHLFADVLRFRLERESPEEVGRLHRRACSWLIDHNRPYDATRHAIELRDWHLAVKLLEPLGGAEVRRFKALLDWIRTLPEEALRAQPVLSLWNTWSELDAGHTRAGERAVDLAEQELKARGDARYRGELLYLRSRIARQRGEGRLAVSLAEQAVAVLSDRPDNTGYAAVLLILSKSSIALGHLIAGAPLEAEAHMREACDLIGQTPGVSDDIACKAYAALGCAQSAQGRLTDAWNTLQDALVIGERSADGPPIQPSIFMAEILIERNELEEAAKVVDDALQRMRQTGAGLGKPTTWMLLARIANAQGNADLALSTLDHIISWSRRNGNRTVQSRAEAFRADIWLTSGDLPRAQAWLDRCSIDLDADMEYDQEPACYVFAKLLLGQCRSSGNMAYCDRGLRILRQIGGEAIRSKRNLDAVKALVLGALARYERGDTAKAFSHLDRALSIAMPERAVRTFLDQGEAMLRLAHAAKERGHGTAQLDAVIAAFDHTVAEKGPNAPAHSARIVELSRREEEILRFVAAGLTNREIADRMFISVNTVKTHLKHVFSKIGATSRAQAIARAFALGLL